MQQHIPRDSEPSARNPRSQALTKPPKKRSIFVRVAQSSGLMKTFPVKHSPTAVRALHGNQQEQSPPSRSPSSHSSGLYCTTQKYTASSIVVQEENTTMSKYVFILEILSFTEIFNIHYHWCPHLFCMSDGQECQVD